MLVKIGVKDLIKLSPKNRCSVYDALQKITEIELTKDRIKDDCVNLLVTIQHRDLARVAFSPREKVPDRADEGVSNKTY